MSFLLVFLSFLDVNNGKVDSIFKTPIYGSVLLFGVLIWTINYYIKIKRIQINSKGIKFSNIFKTEFIQWSDIKKIELTGNSKVMMLLMETTHLTLKNGKQIAIMASYYQNISAIRKSLDQVSVCLNAEEPIELQPKIEISEVEPVGFVNLSRMTKHRGNHFLSLNGLAIYGWIAFSIYIFMTTDLANYFGALFIVLITMFGIFYGFLGFQLHYYYLDKKYLVVKNHVWPWLIHKYKIDNIKQVVFEMPYRKSTSLKVITKDCKSKLYPGGSLRNSNWQDLLNEFENLKMDIRKETNF